MLKFNAWDLIAPDLLDFAAASKTMLPFVIMSCPSGNSIFLQVNVAPRLRFSMESTATVGKLLLYSAGELFN